MALSSTNLLGQISPTPTGNFGTGNFTTTAFTPPSNSLLVVGISIIENSGTTTDPLSSITVSGGGWTYTGGPGVTVSPTSFPTSTKIFTAPVGAGASMTLTIGTGGRSIGEYSVSVVAWTGYNTGTPTGATATGSQNGGFAGPPTPFSITLSAATASTSNVFAVAGMDKSVAGATPGTTGTCTEVDDLENTDWGGLESQIRTGSTSTTVDWADLRSGGGALFNVAAVAIEILAATTDPGPAPAPQVGPGRISPSGQWQQFPFTSDVTTVAISVADTGTATDAVTIVATVPIADTGSGVDAIAATATVPLADAGSATDAASVSAVVPVAESGTAADAPTEAATVPLTDTGTGADAIAAGVPVGVGDTGSGSDAAGITATVPIVETGSATDAITVTVTLSIADSGTGADARTTLAALALAEAASALDVLGIAATVPLVEAGAGADAVGVQTGGAIVKNIADSGSGRDRIHVLVRRPGPGTTTRPAGGTTARPNTGITYYQ